MHWGSESTESLLEEGPGLVQMFDQSSLWEEIGYHVAAGSLEDGKHVILERTSKSSPEFLESHSDIDDLIMFKQFDSKEEQDQWVANEIQTNLTEDELLPDDIIVINPPRHDQIKRCAYSGTFISKGHSVSHSWCRHRTRYLL